jgi:hypothetical protein
MSHRCHNKKVIAVIAMDHIIGSIVLFNADLLDWSVKDVNNCNIVSKAVSKGIASQKNTVFWHEVHRTFPKIYAKFISTQHAINAGYFFKILLAIHMDPTQASIDSILSQIKIHKLFDREALRVPNNIQDVMTMNLLLACQDIPYLNHFTIFTVTHLMCIMTVNELFGYTTRLTTNHMLRIAMIIKCLEFEKMAEKISSEKVPEATLSFVQTTVPKMACNVKLGIFKILRKQRRD